MKGLIKGLKYLSHIFENEKEEEMQIGFPTDVKHVAHIGCDGPSTTAPSWMNDFKNPPEFSSPLLGKAGEDNASRNGASKESKVRSVQSQSSPRGDSPKSNRRHSTGESDESPSKSTRNKPKQSKRSSKNSQPKDSSESLRGSELPGIPKKPRKKSKESGSSIKPSSRSKPQAPDENTLPHSDPGSGTGNVTRFKSADLYSNTTNPFANGEENLARIS